jgi:hypothetical protein
MAQVITVDFGERRVIGWGRDSFVLRAERCEREAANHTGETAATLRRCADRYYRAAGRPEA